jgi:hypothetical protein
LAGITLSTSSGYLVLPQLSTYLKVLAPKPYVKEEISAEQLAKDAEFAKEYSRKKVRATVCALCRRQTLCCTPFFLSNNFLCRQYASNHKVLAQHADINPSFAQNPTTVHMEIVETSKASPH